MKGLVLILCGAAAWGATATFSREYAAAQFARGPALSAFAQLAAGTGVPAVPMSSRSMREMFETCGAVQQGAIYKLQTPATQAAVDAGCAGLARAALARNPTYGAAHTVLMFSSGERSAIAQALVLSQITAPLESWHAKLRLLKGLDFFGTGQAEMDRALRRDIGFMVQTPDGRAWLARLYRGRPDLGKTLALVIDQQPDILKARFVQEIARLDGT